MSSGDAHKNPYKRFAGPFSARNLTKKQKMCRNKKKQIKVSLDFVMISWKERVDFIFSQMVILIKGRRNLTNSTVNTINTLTAAITKQVRA